MTQESCTSLSLHSSHTAHVCGSLLVMFVTLTSILKPSFLVPSVTNDSCVISKTLPCLSCSWSCSELFKLIHLASFSQPHWSVQHPLNRTTLQAENNLRVLAQRLGSHSCAPGFTVAMLCHSKHSFQRVFLFVTTSSSEPHHVSLCSRPGPCLSSSLFSVLLVWDFSCWEKNCVSFSSSGFLSSYGL